MYTENHAIVAWFKKGFAGEKKQTKYRVRMDVPVSKAPSGRELPTKSGEGERVTIKSI